MNSSMQGSSGMRGPTGSSGNAIPSGYKMGQMQQFTPEQMQLFSSMFGNVGPNSFTARLAGGDQSQFAQMEEPALQQFSGLQGNLASRFSGMGMGARKSSGFQNASNQATSEFAQGLQSQRLGIQNQAIQDLMNMSQNLLGQKPYENFMIKNKPKFWEALMGALGENLGALPEAIGKSQGWF